MTAWRLAASSAFDLRHRDGFLRYCAVVVATTLAVLTSLLALSTLRVADQAETRLTGRLGQLSSGDAPSDVIMQESEFRWDDETVTVVAIERMGNSPAPPPGIVAVPKPGTSVVSPRLAQMAANDPLLAGQLRISGWIRAEGLTDPDELFAYTGVAQGTLSDADPMRDVDGHYAGSGPMAMVKGFGPGAALPIAVAAGRELPQAMELRSFSAALLMAALILLVVSLSFASPARNRRLALLEALGVTTFRRGTLLAAEALLLTGPPTILAALLWQPLSQRLARLPLTRRAAFPGDAALPISELATFVGLVLVLAALMGGLLALRSVGGTGVRPTSRRERTWGVGWITLGASALVFREAVIRGGEVDASLYMLGSVLAVIGATMAVGPLMRAVGKVLHRSRSVSLSVAGASMDREPLRAGRPFLSLVALVTLSAVAAGYLLLARTTEGRTAEPNGVHAVQVAWRGTDPAAELAMLKRALPQAVILSVHSHGENTDGTLTVGGTCQDLQRIGADTRCDARGSVTGQVVEVLGREVLAGQQEPRVQLTSADLKPEMGRSDVLVLTEGTLDRVVEEVQASALGALPFSQVSSALDSDPRVSPLVEWIEAGILGAALVSAFACLLALIDRFRRTSGVTPVLPLLGVGPGAEGRLRAVSFAAPYFTGTALALLVGSTAAALVSNAVKTPWGGLAWLAVMVVCIGAVGTALVAVPARLLLRPGTRD